MDKSIILMQYAQKSLMYEVTLSPKPGLVDRINNGSHDDMNIFTFMDAINALTPYLYKYAELGRHHEGTPRSLFKAARTIGCEAENDMMKATKQVNTHKGANFSFAILLSASGFLLKESDYITVFHSNDTDRLFKYVAEMCKGLVSHDFKKINEKKNLSHGERLYKEHGIRGIRGVAEEGYPILTKMVLPYLRKNLLIYPNNKEGVLLHALSLIMSEAEDTNLIQRGGNLAFKNVRKQAKQIFDKYNPLTIHVAFKEFDEILIKQNLSPGGAADLLSIAIYVVQLEGIL